MHSIIKKGISFIFVIFLSSCASLPLGANLINKAQNPAEKPGQLFFDDFSETSSGWDRFQGEIGLTDYVKETYRIQVNEPNTDLFATPGLFFKDVIIEVRANRISGPIDNNFGVICRYQDEKNFYSAQISSDGYAGIFRMKNGVLKLLCHESMLPVPAILGGASINSIYFECIGSSLTLAVNGVPVDTCDDKSFKDGDIGLIAGTYKEGGTLVAFDDLRIIQP